MSYDASVDVYLTTKTIHEARPGVWPHPDTVLALYKAVELFLQQAGPKPGHTSGKRVI